MPCFVFNVGFKGAAEAATHEAGHTLGLCTTTATR